MSPSSMGVAMASDGCRMELANSATDPAFRQPIQRQLSMRLWHWRIYIVVLTAVASVVLMAWIGYLAVSLRAVPAEAAWRTTWIGFDLVELGAYAIAAWSAWRRRLVVVPALYLAAILLLADAWFDVTLAWGTGGWWTSFLLAAFIEIPLALVLGAFAYRMSVASRVALYVSVGLPAALAVHPSLVPPSRSAGRLDLLGRDRPGHRAEAG